MKDMDKEITVRVPAPMKKYLEEIASSRLLKVSDIVREALLTLMSDEVKTKIWKENK